MNSSRMSNKDMLNYCDEALAWEEFGAVDIFFFESVKKILMGECSVEEEPEIDDLLGIERPVGAQELAPDYDKYADEYYDGDTENTDITDNIEENQDNEIYTINSNENDICIETEEISEEMKIFADTIFADGFFDSEDTEDDDDDDDENFNCE